VFDDSVLIFVCLFVHITTGVVLNNIRPRVLYVANLGVAGCGLRRIGAGSVVSCFQTVNGEPTHKLPFLTKTSQKNWRKWFCWWMDISGVRGTVSECGRSVAKYGTERRRPTARDFQHCCLLLVRGNCYSRTKKVGNFNRRAEVGKGRERWRRPVWGRLIVCGRVGPRSLRTQQEDVRCTP
jgi:hypothetical protein